MAKAVKKAEPAKAPGKTAATKAPAKAPAKQGTTRRKTVKKDPPAESNPAGGEVITPTPPDPVAEEARLQQEKSEKQSVKDYVQDQIIPAAKSEVKKVRSLKKKVLIALAIALGIVLIKLFIVDPIRSNAVDRELQEVKDLKNEVKELKAVTDSQKQVIDEQEVLFADIYNTATDAKEERIKAQVEGERTRQITKTNTDELKKTIRSKATGVNELDSIRDRLLRAGRD